MTIHIFLIQISKYIFFYLLMLYPYFWKLYGFIIVKDQLWGYSQNIMNIIKILVFF